MGVLAGHELRRHNIIGINNPVGNSLSLAARVAVRLCCFCGVLICTALAQPQAPITWGAMRLLPTPTLGDDDYITSVWSHGDTLVAVAGYRVPNENDYFPELAFSTDNGDTFGPWRILYSQNHIGVWTGQCWLVCVSDGILCLTFDPLNPRSDNRGFWKTTDLGQTWQWPDVTFLHMRYYDRNGDTLFCSTYPDSVTWTCDGGHTFAPRRSVGFEPQSIWDLAVSLRHVHTMTWAVPSDTSRQRVRYARGPLLEGEFDSVRVINPNIGWTDRAAIAFGDDGTGIILSCDEYQPPAPDLGAMILNVTHDDGMTCSPADTLTPNESSVYYWHDIWHWNHWWLACWIDTVRDPGFDRWGLRCAFSPNNGRFWYPSQQIDGSGDYSNYDLCGEIGPSWVRISMGARHRIQPPYEYYFAQWEGQILADAIPPVVTALDIPPDTVENGATLSFMAEITDEDTVFGAMLRVRSGDDTTVIPMEWTELDYVAYWTVPHEGRYWYRMEGEDRWENIGSYPDGGWATFVTEGWIDAVDEIIAPPSSFNLSVYPNPSNPTTTLAFTLPHTSLVSLTVFNLLGQSVYESDLGRLEAGEHRQIFDGSALPSGVYLARVEAAGTSQMRKMMLLK